jgi:hypothetical protein
VTPSEEHTARGSDLSGMACRSLAERRLDQQRLQATVKESSMQVGGRNEEPPLEASWSPGGGTLRFTLCPGLFRSPRNREQPKSGSYIPRWAVSYGVNGVSRARDKQCGHYSGPRVPNNQSSCSAHAGTMMADWSDPNTGWQLLWIKGSCIACGHNPSQGQHS